MTMYIVVMPVKCNVMGGRHGFEIPLVHVGGVVLVESDQSEGSTVFDWLTVRTPITTVDFLFFFNIMVVNRNDVK